MPRAKTSENGVVRQRLSLSDVGLKYLAMSATCREASEEEEGFATAISLNHVPHGVKDGSDKKILVDMLLWAMENKAPANVVLISGDGDYSYVLHRLRMIGYNVLLVRPEHASRFLIAAANTIWLWRSIVAAGG
ncbi:unnamed protein product [Eruca vesicaria subsp. sativa]|uniref:NYN domain-containing protein n=1 Tax=Eruca vesicaria subsp. sativa TaxID=29727 RepID=A0ABC8KTY0_ERUVS|nr:unnamed protein product [Eruca vesicaria subsp. sativa]